MKEARADWAASAPAPDAGKLVSLDETWATTNMARAHGRAPRGERPVRSVPAGHWHTTTLVCGPRADGLVAPLVLDGAVDGRTFLAYVRRMLAPTLRAGDTAVMDNLGSHKVACHFPKSVSLDSRSGLQRPGGALHVGPIRPGHLLRVAGHSDRMLRTAAHFDQMRPAAADSGAC